MFFAVLALLLVFGSFLLEESPDTPGAPSHTQTDQHWVKGKAGNSALDYHDNGGDDDNKCEILRMKIITMLMRMVLIAMMLVIMIVIEVVMLLLAVMIMMMMIMILMMMM